MSNPNPIPSYLRYLNQPEQPDQALINPIPGFAIRPPKVKAEQAQLREVARIARDWNCAVFYDGKYTKIKTFGGTGWFLNAAIAYCRENMPEGSWQVYLCEPGSGYTYCLRIRKLD